MSNFFRSPLALGLAVLLALAGGATYWAVEKNQQRERIAREQANAEQQEQQRIAANEARRKLEQQRLQDELLAKRDVEEKQHQLDIEFRQAELTRKQFVSDERPLPLDERTLREREYRAQAEAARDLQRAQNEVIRQKNYVSGRENERTMDKYRREVEAEQARQAQAPN